LRYLENETIKVGISKKGAELKSFYSLKDEMEFLWDGNPDVWGRTSPVLFPIVGGLKDGEYIYKGKVYKLGQHGFARDLDFEVVEEKEGSITYLLSSNEETRKVYPFEFNFYINYKLEKNKLIIGYKVENLGKEEMLFSLGAHPAFATPTDEEIKFSDYYLEFEKVEKASIYPLNGRYISREKIPYLKNEKIVELREDIFKNDALIFKDLKSNKVSLRCKKSSRRVTMDYSDFEYIAFWNKVGAKFVCLEPWNGIADFEDSNKKLENKDGIIKLGGKGIYTVNLEISINNGQIIIDNRRNFD
jgi:galactose mutarotase-like enzyme